MSELIPHRRSEDYFPSLFTPRLGQLFTNPWSDDFFKGFFEMIPSVDSISKFNPATDVIEHPDHYQLSLDLPGVRAEDVEILVQNGVLTVRGQRVNQSEDQQEGYTRVERSWGSFSRSFQLPQGAGPKQVEAHIDNGVLNLFIDKSTADIDQIPIKVDKKSSEQEEK